MQLTAKVGLPLPAFDSMRLSAYQNCSSRSVLGILAARDLRVEASPLGRQISSYSQDGYLHGRVATVGSMRANESVARVTPVLVWTIGQRL